MSLSTPDEFLRVLQQEITICFRCPRLVKHREEIGITKRRAYQQESYWSRPVPGFGDPAARVLVVGLAPGAHGANRTGRMFTGDRSGEFLFRALWETGFANQPDSLRREDGLQLNDLYLTAAVRCVPPDNRPTPDEILTCRPFLVRERSLLTNVQIVVALGNIGLQSYLSILQAEGRISSRSQFAFGHSRVYETHGDGPKLVTSYHPSQQNTSTKKLTAEMLRNVFALVRTLLVPVTGRTSPAVPLS